MIRSMRIRPAQTAFLLLAMLVLAAAPAQARKHAASKQSDADAQAKKPESSKPQQVATFGDWGAYLAKVGKGKTCYALATPKERRPEVKRDAAYIFISDRPAEKVHNEVSIIMGFPLKDGAKAEAKVGRASFELVSKGSNAWIKNPEDEAKFVDTLQHGGTLIVKAAAAKGPPTVDSYALDGLKPALALVTKDCK